ncbi:MAG: hypothetical protein AB1505_27175 [Candidatus Latescibacterota bacterium]
MIEAAAGWLDTSEPARRALPAEPIPGELRQHVPDHLRARTGLG